MTGKDRKQKKDDDLKALVLKKERYVLRINLLEAKKDILNSDIEHFKNRIKETELKYDKILDS